MTINWDISREDFDTLVLVAKRALRKLPDYPDDRRTLIMDLNACHSNGCPLDFMALLVAPVDLLAHDIYGIRKAVNRDTGKLTEDVFLPCLIRSGNRLAEVMIARAEKEERK